MSGVVDPGEIMLFWKFVLISFLLNLSISSRGLAADIAKSDSTSCLIRISGKINEGDFDQFKSIAKNVFSVTAETADESTSSNVVCLDSPGGSLTEGVKFAEHFYTAGVGTILEERAVCYSVCAIMFMMGKAEGPEVAFANRKMHYTAKLGFHRPSLATRDERKLPPELLSHVVDTTFEATMRLLAIANKTIPWSSEPMMKSDLIEGMLTHVGSDFLMIDTIDKAGRWGIVITGVNYEFVPTKERAYFACNNSIQWKVGLTSSSYSYTEGKDSGYDEVRQLSNDDSGQYYQVSGRNSGLAVDYCFVKLNNDSVSGCGFSEYYEISVGRGECEMANFETNAFYMSVLSILDPYTKLTDISEALSPQTRQDKIREESGLNLICIVLTVDGVIADKEPCQKDVKYSESVTHEVYKWPSGSETFVSYGRSTISLNGIATQPFSNDTYGTCFKSGATGNSFCVRQQ